MQIVDTRIRNLPFYRNRGGADDIQRGIGILAAREEENRAAQARAAELEAQRQQELTLQRLGFQHEDTQQGARFAHEDTARREGFGFQERLQGNEFQHEDTAREDTQSFTSGENALHRALQDRLSARSDATQRYGIDRDYDLGSRRLEAEADLNAAQADYYRRGGARGASAGGFITPATVASVVNAAARDRALGLDEVLPTARERVDSIMSWSGFGPQGALPTVDPRLARMQAAPTFELPAADAAPPAGHTAESEYEALWQEAQKRGYTRAQFEAQMRGQR